jgi:PPOX class probable F420-dependent enzyme
LMAHETVLDFVRANSRAVLATYRRDGQAQLSPVSASVDAEGRVVISTREGAMKTLNLRRTPRAALCVISQQFFGEWHSLEGSVEIVSLPDAMEPLVDYYRRISGEHPERLPRGDGARSPCAGAHHRRPERTDRPGITAQATLVLGVIARSRGSTSRE